MNKKEDGFWDWSGEDCEDPRAAEWAAIGVAVANAVGVPGWTDLQRQAFIADVAEAARHDELLDAFSELRPTKKERREFEEDAAACERVVAMLRSRRARVGTDASSAAIRAKVRALAPRFPLQEAIEALARGSREEAEKLKRQAKSRGKTRNPLLVRAMFDLLMRHGIHPAAYAVTDRYGDATGDHDGSLVMACSLVRGQETPMASWVVKEAKKIRRG